MALQITEKNGTFYLNGAMNAITSKFFIIHITYLLLDSSINKNVYLNMRNVTKIDKNGALALETLNSISTMNNKNLIVVGGNGEKIYDCIKVQNAA